MNPKIRRALTNCISILVIICLLHSMLPPPVYMAPLPPPPDYTENLLAILGTLEQDDDGNLSFPHPEARPGSARGMVLPYAELGIPLLDLDPLPNLLADMLPISGQSSRSGQTPTEYTSPLSASSRPLPPTFAPPLRLTISGYSGPLPLQSQMAITQVYLPLVMNNNQGPPSSVVGKKAIFAVLLPDANVLSTGLGFSARQIVQVQTVIEAEQSAIAALNTEMQVILNDDRLTTAEKQAAIAAANYNERLLTILSGSGRSTAFVQNIF
jgi:hypothetical protein